MKNVDPRVAECYRMEKFLNDSGGGAAVWVVNNTPGTLAIVTANNQEIDAFHAVAFAACLRVSLDRILNVLHEASGLDKEEFCSAVFVMGEAIKNAEPERRIMVDRKDKE